MQSRSSARIAMKSSDRSLYLRLLAYVRPHWRVFALAVVFMLGSAATEPVFPAILQRLLDNGFKTAGGEMVWLIPLGIVALFALRAVFTFSTGYLMAWVSSRVVRDIRRELFARMLLYPVSTFQTQSAGKLISRIVNDVSNLSESATNVLVSSTRETLTAAALLGYLIYLDWKMTLWVMLIAPMIATIVQSFSHRMRSASRMGYESMRQISHTIEETVVGHKVVKTYSGQEQQTRRFAADTHNLMRAMMREAIPACATTPVTQLAASLTIAVIVYLALSQAAGQAGASAGNFVAFITALLLLIAPIKQLTTINTNLQKGLAACESVFELMDAPIENDPGEKVLEHAKGQIDFEHVCFSYPGSTRLALEDVNFHVPPGQTVALVGASGGGKTTISALIPRFYTPNSGRILLDGIDIQDLTLASLRHNIALVSQDIVLFNDTVEANIAFGACGEYAREDVISAAKAAHAWEFIQRLPEGLDTMIGEDGAKLSGGQRQRVAIARALLKNAPILILDEATSALDTESERQVQAALTTLMTHRTTLVIAHRLSTIEHADHILVLDNGRVVESGTHTELLAKGGYYANLTRMQT